MPRIPLIIPATSAPGRFGPETSGRIVNGFIEQQTTAKRSAVMYCREGLTTLATAPIAGNCRGMIEVDGAGYALIGTQMYRVDAAGALTNIGGIPGNGAAFMARNRASPIPHVAITTTDGLNYLIIGGALTTVEDADLRSANSVTAIAGYFVWTHPDGEYSWSEIDSIAVDGLASSTAEANPDGLVRGIEHRGELYLFGQRSTEVHGLTGDVDTPFARSAHVALGCLAPASVVSLENTIAWVAHDGTVRAGSSYQGDRISTHSVERAIAAAADPSKIRAIARTREGHSFYELSWAEATWIYDFRTGSWAEVHSYQQARMRSESYMQIGSRHIVGDVSNGKIYELSPSVNSDDGDPILWTTELVAAENAPERMTFDRVDLEFVAGVGLNSTDAEASDPHVMLTYSDDGGRTWTNERSAPVGKIGEYSKTVSFHRLGTSRRQGRRFRVSVAASVSRCMVGAWANVTAAAT